jgi:hypothetical protein
MRLAFKEHLLPTGNFPHNSGTGNGFSPAVSADPYFGMPAPVEECAWLWSVQVKRNVILGAFAPLFEL